MIGISILETGVNGELLWHCEIVAFSLGRLTRNVLVS